MKNILAMLLLVFCVSAFDCGKSSPNVPQTNFTYSTPNGVEIKSVVAIAENKQDAVFEAIDRGIEIQIRASSLHNPAWAKGANISDYRVLFVEPQTINQETAPGSPAIFVGGIQTAGTVWGTNGEMPLTLVIPHQANQNWEFLGYLKDTARREAEHFREFLCDREIFKRFAVRGDTHPHWKLEGE